MCLLGFSMMVKVFLQQRMSRNVVGKVIELMKRQRVRRLPVMENECLVGMLSLGDAAVHVARDVVGETLNHISQPARPENI